MKRRDKMKLKTRRLEGYERIPYELLLLADESMAAINRYVMHSDIYVLERGGKPIAVYVLYGLNEYELEIKNIAVDRAYQGRGIGGFLLQDAAARAAEKGYSSLLIGTAETAVKQLALYRKAGFGFHTIRKDFFTANYPVPIVEGGVPLQHMVVLRKEIRC